MTPDQIDAVSEALIRFEGGAQVAAAFQASAELIGGSNPSMDATRSRNEKWAAAMRELLAEALNDPRSHPAECGYHVDQYLHECTCHLRRKVQP